VKNSHIHWSPEAAPYGTQEDSDTESNVDTDGSIWSEVEFEIDEQAVDGQEAYEQKFDEIEKYYDEQGLSDSSLAEEDAEKDEIIVETVEDVSNYLNGSYMETIISTDGYCRAMKSVRLVVRNDKTTVGTLTGRLIDRVKMGGRWRTMIATGSSEFSDFAQVVFDEGGWVKAEWWKDSSQTCSHPWYEKLCRNDFLIVQNIEVGAERCSKEIGICMIQAAIKIASDRKAIHVFAWPEGVVVNPTVGSSTIQRGSGCIGDEETTAGTESEKSVALLSASGFRRIGTSSWFAYALDEDNGDNEVCL
jgi:hypothetical protein